MPHESILDHFGVQQPARKGRKADAESELEARIKQLESRLEAERPQQIVVQAPQVQPQQQAEAPLVDLSGLPDQFVDPPAYEKELAARVQKAILKGQADVLAQVDRTVAARASADQQYNDLWSGFKSKYPDYARNEKVVEFAASQAIERIRQLGHDPSDFMRSNSDDFLALVANEAKDFFPAPQQTQNDDFNVGGDPLPHEDRTASVFGGSAPTPQRQGKSPDKPVDMFADLREIQRASGFY